MRKHIKCAQPPIKARRPKPGVTPPAEPILCPEDDAEICTNLPVGADPIPVLRAIAELRRQFSERAFRERGVKATEWRDRWQRVEKCMHEGMAALHAVRPLQTEKEDNWHAQSVRELDKIRRRAELKIEVYATKANVRKDPAREIVIHAALVAYPGKLAVSPTKTGGPCARYLATFLKIVLGKDEVHPAATLVTWIREEKTRRAIALREREKREKRLRLQRSRQRKQRRAQAARS